MRRTIAARMVAGAHETAPVTLTTKCDATNLVNLRNQFRAAQTGRDPANIPGYNDFFIKLAACALEHHPLLAAQWQASEITIPAGIHIAVAIDTDAGLVAPVVRNANQLSLRQVADETRMLIELARTGRLTPDQMQGGIFTITNLGMYDVDAFTPIINLPQSSILGIGRIVREPTVVNDTIVPRDQVTLSLTFDHRVIDGAPAARFLQTLRQSVENPGPWLVS